MRKILMVLAAVFALSLGAGPGTCKVQAKETAPSFRGSIIYQQEGKEAAWYVEDLILLEDRLSAMPEDTFDPACYTHTHRWEYRDINEKTHTRHCAVCGSAYDLTAAHTARQEEDCPIDFEGETYPGRRYTCICGYQWVREAAHELVFETVDETNHRIRCALDDTDYCRGHEPVEEEHYAYTYVPCQDGTHHKKICIDCGFIAGEEDCSFTQKPIPGEEDDRDPNLFYCACGNGRAEPSLSDAPAEHSMEDGNGMDPPTKADTEDTAPKPGGADGNTQGEDGAAPPEGTGEGDTTPKPGGADGNAQEGGGAASPEGTGEGGTTPKPGGDDGNAQEGDGAASPEGIGTEDTAGQTEPSAEDVTDSIYIPGLRFYLDSAGR